MSRFMRLCFVLAICAAGCLGGEQKQSPTGPAPGSSDMGVADLSMNDLTPPPPRDFGPPPDMWPSDIAGLTNCYFKSICDPTMEFCIRYYSGSQAQPGAISNGPSCYRPSDPCADNGLPMDCSCIQNDAMLAMLCQTCVDNQDGTYDCYAQQ
jgi:hypothetical protein